MSSELVKLRKELDEMVVDGYKRIDELRDMDKNQGIRVEPIGVCKLCRGQIVIKTVITSPMMSPDQAVSSSSCYCDKCGICYNPEVVNKITAKEKEMR